MPIRVSIDRFHPVDLGIVADADLGLRAIDAALAGRQLAGVDASVRRRRPPGAGRRRRRRRRRDGRRPCRVMATIRSALGRDAIVVKDSTVPGSCGPTALLEVYEPRTSMRPVSAAIGPGLPLAIGASLATGRPTVVIQGDGGFMLNLGELATAVQEGAADHHVRVQRPRLRDPALHPGHDVRGPAGGGRSAHARLRATAQSMGMPSSSVASPAEFEKAFAAAVAIGEPWLIDVDITSMTPMRVVPQSPNARGRRTRRARHRRHLVTVRLTARSGHPVLDIENVGDQILVGGNGFDPGAVTVCSSHAGVGRPIRRCRSAVALDRRASTRGGAETASPRATSTSSRSRPLGYRGRWLLAGAGPTGARARWPGPGGHRLVDGDEGARLAARSTARYSASTSASSPGPGRSARPCDAHAVPEQPHLHSAKRSWCSSATGSVSAPCRTAARSSSAPASGRGRGDELVLGVDLDALGDEAEQRRGFDHLASHRRSVWPSPRLRLRYAAMAPFHRTASPSRRRQGRAHRRPVSRPTWAVLVDGTARGDRLVPARRTGRPRRAWNRTPRSTPGHAAPGALPTEALRGSTMLRRPTSSTVLGTRARRTTCLDRTGATPTGGCTLPSGHDRSG